jgi:hypothetical protein
MPSVPINTNNVRPYQSINLSIKQAINQASMQASKQLILGRKNVRK